MRRRGARSTLTMQAQTAAFIHFSNVKQPPVEWAATVLQIRKVRPPNLRIDGELGKAGVEYFILEVSAQNSGWGCDLKASSFQAASWRSHQ
jgi:hypothetical protein